MIIIRGIDSIPQGLARPVVTIGNFDGVHLGHQELLNRVIKRANEISGTGVVITFEPHPVQVLRPEKAPRRLTSLIEKLEIFQSLGIKVVVCIDFTMEFARLSPDDFIKSILHERIGARYIIVGSNYKFGKDQGGNVGLLEERGKIFGFEVEMVEPVEIDGQRVSSSRVREYLVTGRVDRAAVLLGRYYSIEGVVTTGHHRGMELGYPTANIYTVDETLPLEGIYAIKVVHGASLFSLRSMQALPLSEAKNETTDGVCYIGTQPTFSGEKIGVEVHLFNFDGPLYHEHLKILFIKMIREEKKFADRESLIKQIKDDVEKAKEALKLCY